MGWLDDAAAWVDDRKKEAEALAASVAKAAEPVVKAATEPILMIEKAGREWTAELEEIVLKYGNTPYEVLPQLIKDKLKELNVSKEQLTEVTEITMNALKEAPGEVLPMPGDLFGAVKQILICVRDLSSILTNWQRYSTKIFTDLDEYFKELGKYGR